MQIDFTPEQISQLSRIASHQGKNAEQLAKDIVLRSLEDNARFLAAVDEGIAQADRGEFVEHEEVLKRIDRILQQ